MEDQNLTFFFKMTVTKLVSSVSLSNDMFLFAFEFTHLFI